MEESLSEYWKAVKPILKEQNQQDRFENYDKRIQYAIQQFEENNIEYKLCNENNGHFNLFKNGKVVISFWSWTGKIYSTQYNFEDYRGIKNCVKLFNKYFK